MYVSMDSRSWELKDDVLDFVCYIDCGRFGNGACIVCLEKYISPSRGAVCGTWGKILFQVLDMGDTQLV